MKTLKCDQCPKTFTKPTMAECEASMRMHVGRKHGNIKTPSGPKAKAVPVEDKPKRAYTKAAKATVTHEVNINFCPCCGFDMHTAALGMAMAAKLKH